MSAIGPVGLAVRGASLLVWFPSAVVLLVLVGLAGAPAVVVAQGIVDAGRRLTTDPFTSGFFLALAVAFAYALFAFLLAAVVPLHKRLLRLRLRPGRIPLASPRMFLWYHLVACTFTVRLLAGPLLQATGLYRFYARAMGARVGRNAFINSTNLFDHDLLTIGDHALVGGDAWIVGHTAERGHLVLAPVRIGDGASVGLRATVLPGATLEDGCHVGAMALVPKHARLAAGTLYGGVPARPLDDPQPGSEEE